MTQVVDASIPKMKYKTFSYHTQMRWVGGKAGIIKSDQKPEFRVASPPEFKGESGVWTPEDLFVASVESCVLMTFAAFSQRLNLAIVSYESHAEGILEYSEGSYRFTRIVLRPHVTVKPGTEFQEVEKTLRDAHEKCLITNSIHSKVTIEPKIETVSEG